MQNVIKFQKINFGPTLSGLEILITPLFALNVKKCFFKSLFQQLQKFDFQSTNNILPKVFICVQHHNRCSIQGHYAFLLHMSIEKNTKHRKMRYGRTNLIDF